mmetsp:Transcript_4955/g.7155  ORF Transcript_4955/g.7155 Transcript_4955/m.7155 type:complete len:305 (+) Transcript_4955:54-968(+)
MLPLASSAANILFLLCTSLLVQNSDSFNPPYNYCSRSPFQRIVTAFIKSSDSDEATQQVDPQFRERNRRWIVLVDDEEGIRQTVGDYLYDQGYKVTACADATALLQVVSLPSTLNNDDAQPLPVLPDVIISDIRMPGKDGMDLLRYVRGNARLERVPLVLLTAKPMTQDRIDGYDAGADRYLTKPFDPEELLAIIDNLIVRKKQMTKGKAQLVEVAEELQNIKQILKINAVKVVQKTDVYLTPTQREVLDFVCEGKRNKEIAIEKGITHERIKSIMQELYFQTETTTRTELVRWALKTGYVSRR